VLQLKPITQIGAGVESLILASFDPLA